VWLGCRHQFWQPRQVVSGLGQGGCHHQSIAVLHQHVPHESHARCLAIGLAVQLGPGVGASPQIVRIGRNGCVAGTRASQLTYENNPSDRISPPRIANSQKSQGELNHVRAPDGTAFPQPVRVCGESGFGAWYGKKCSVSRSTIADRAEPFPDCATQKWAFFAISAADAADFTTECVGKLARITNTRRASLLFSGQIGFAPRPKPDSPQTLGRDRS
jgi:hypothetical protein